MAIVAIIVAVPTILIAVATVVVALLVALALCLGGDWGSFVLGQFNLPVGEWFAIGAKNWRIGLSWSRLGGLRLRCRSCWLRLLEDHVDEFLLLGTRRGLHAERAGDCHQLLTILCLKC